MTTNDLYNTLVQLDDVVTYGIAFSIMVYFFAYFIGYALSFIREIFTI